jgi:hypothetical protein
MAGGRASNDYGDPVVRSNRMHRPGIIANHALHWTSSVIVLGITAYFIAKFSNNTHLVYWICVVGAHTTRVRTSVADSV